MGQAWCKEKSTKVQDSKSPLDRVFLRCAHRIYPSLKEEGSVLGGATQRVTSSEIGYASSPSREVLTRGQSIDSVDRPFHPNDWVDVNLEVPGTPRPSSVMTNFTLDTTLYPPTTLSSTNSSGSNPRNFTPIPPPRHRKKNRGRPLPPKPDEVSRTHVDRLTTNNCSKESRYSCHEPLYSSVKLHKTRTGDKKVFEHKVNGTGRVISCIVPAGKASNSDERGPMREDRDNSIRKNSSSVSLPNYLEPETSNDDSLSEIVGEIKVRKIMAAESLPLLIGSCATEDATRNAVDMRQNETIDVDNDDNERKRSMDEVDFLFDATISNDTANSIVKLDEPRLTSTPLKNNFEDDCGTPKTGGGWFLHQDRAPKSDKSEYSETKNLDDKWESVKSEFHETTESFRSAGSLVTEENPRDNGVDNRTRIERTVEFESEKPRTRTKTGRKRTLSNESEPFDSYEEKELRSSESADALPRSNTSIELRNRSISEESLPAEMVDRSKVDDYFDDDKHGSSKKNTTKNVVDVAESMRSDAKTPPPSPEPKIKPEIFDNDHSTLLKVLRDEAEESNLSSMTPSLTELEAALSDMLEREDDDEKLESQRKKIDNIVAIENKDYDESLERPIRPEIHVEKTIKKSEIPVSLKNIFDVESTNQKDSAKIISNDSAIEIDRGNGDEHCEATNHDFVEIALNDCSGITIPGLVPPAKPSRLHQIGLEATSTKSEAMPTPPRRRNRSSASGHSTTVFRDNGGRTNDIAVTLEDSYSNDRLI